MRPVVVLFFGTAALVTLLFLWPGPSPTETQLAGRAPQRGAAPAEAQLELAGNGTSVAETQAAVKSRAALVGNEASGSSVETRGPLRGRVVYQSTGQGIPFTTFTVTGEGVDPIRVRTDGRGEFRETRFSRAMELTAEWPTDFGERRSFTSSVSFPFDPASEAPVEIEVELWPTFWLDVDLPESVTLAELEVELCRRSLSGSIESVGGRAFWRLDRTLSLNARRWLATVPPRAWTLVVRDADGFLEAAVDLDRMRGVHPGDLPVRFDARGVVHYELVRSNGGKLPEQAYRVELVRLGERAGVDPARLQLPARRAAIEHVLPGAHELHVETGLCGEQVLPVNVEAGKRTMVAVELDCPIVGGEIRVNVTSRTGTIRGGLGKLRLSRGGSLAATSGAVEWTEDDGRWSGECLFDDLPPGEWTLDFITLSVFGTTPAPPISISTGDTLDLVFLDDSQRADLGFRVFDDTTGEPVRGFTVVTLPEGIHKTTNDVQNGEIVVTDFPIDGRLPWKIVADGYRTASGDIDSFTDGDGDPRFADVRLQRR